MSEKSNKISHLEHIQATIIRMAGSSFLIKGWSVTLVTGLFALAAVDLDASYLIIAYLPSVSFWILDGFYLSQERMFRRLYDEVRKKSEKDVDFSMDISHLSRDQASWLDAMFSDSTKVFHLTIISALLITTIIFLWGNSA